MVLFFHHYFSAFSRKKLAVLLALSWCVGMVLGLYFAFLPNVHSFPAMAADVSSCVSIFSLLAALSLPVLCSFFAAFVSMLWLLVPLSFIKSFSFSYVGSLLFQISESGGWLLRSLCLFSSCVTAWILCWLWLRCCYCNRRSCLISCVIAGVLTLAVGFVDYRFISPFLVNLLS